MFAISQAIFHYIVFFTPPEIQQIRYITRNCVEKYPIQREMKRAIQFQAKKWFHDTILPP